MSRTRGGSRQACNSMLERAGRACSSNAQARGAAGVQACGRLLAVDAAGARGARGLGAGGAGWLGAVHSIHSACFWPGSTWYFS